MTRLTDVEVSSELRICQGDIFEKIRYIEKVVKTDEEINVIESEFPLVIVLTQDCDLAQDYTNRIEVSNNKDKKLISAIVAPLYNYEQFTKGDHLLDEKNIKMRKLDSSTEKGFIKNNQLPRYHYLEFPLEAGFIPSVIDFKHYFCVDIELLTESKSEKCQYKIKAMHRELISQRFANFLSRIGLPSPATVQIQESVAQIT